MKDCGGVASLVLPQIRPQTSMLFLFLFLRSLFLVARSLQR
jgi:hypothetical protein